HAAVGGIQAFLLPRHPGATRAPRAALVVSFVAVVRVRDTVGRLLLSYPDAPFCTCRTLRGGAIRDWLRRAVPVANPRMLLLCRDGSGDGGTDRCAHAKGGPQGKGGHDGAHCRSATGA